MASDPTADEDRDRPAIRLDPDEALRALLKAEPEPIDPQVKKAALKRIREATDEEMAVFADRLREDALKARATEQEIREAENTQPRHEA
jgi:hypothetical protein